MIYKKEKSDRKRNDNEKLTNDEDADSCMAVAVQ